MQDNATAEAKHLTEDGKVDVYKMFKNHAKKAKKEKKKTKYRKISRKHPEFELTYDMMLGIRTTVGMCESKPMRKLSNEDFLACTRLKFPGNGSTITPAHSMRDFKFKDYCPEVFRHCRRRFGTNPVDYLLAVCGNFEYLEFISNSKSGQFFFYTHDSKYMIKTISQDESVFLRKILPQYHRHIMDYPSTLISRFYGMHRVKPHRKPEVHFLIMGSVFYTRRFINIVFDLKGSLQGRLATDKEKKRSNTVYKDQDFLEMKMELHVGKTTTEKLNEQLENDCKLMVELNIMDYSVLLGIHYEDKAEIYYSPCDNDKIISPLPHPATRTYTLNDTMDMEYEPELTSVNEKGHLNHNNNTSSNGGNNNNNNNGDYSSDAGDNIKSSGKVAELDAEFARLSNMVGNDSDYERESHESTNFTNMIKNQNLDVDDNANTTTNDNDNDNDSDDDDDDDDDGNGVAQNDISITVESPKQLFSSSSLPSAHADARMHTSAEVHKYTERMATPVKEAFSSTVNASPPSELSKALSSAHLQSKVNVGSDSKPPRTPSPKRSSSSTPPSTMAASHHSLEVVDDTLSTPNKRTSSSSSSSKKKKKGKKRTPRRLASYSSHTLPRNFSNLMVNHNQQSSASAKTLSSSSSSFSFHRPSSERSGARMISPLSPRGTRRYSEYDRHNATDGDINMASTLPTAPGFPPTLCRRSTLPLSSSFHPESPKYIRDTNTNHSQPRSPNLSTSMGRYANVSYSGANGVGSERVQSRYGLPKRYNQVSYPHDISHKKLFPQINPIDVDAIAGGRSRSRERKHRSASPTNSRRKRNTHTKATPQKNGDHDNGDGRESSTQVAETKTKQSTHASTEVGNEGGSDNGNASVSSEGGASANNTPDPTSTAAAVSTQIYANTGDEHDDDSNGTKSQKRWLTRSLFGKKSKINENCQASDAMNSDTESNGADGNKGTGDSSGNGHRNNDGVEEVKYTAKAELQPSIDTAIAAAAGGAATAAETETGETIGNRTANDQDHDKDNDKDKDKDKDKDDGASSGKAASAASNDTGSANFNDITGEDDKNNDGDIGTSKDAGDNPSNNHKQGDSGLLDSLSVRGDHDVHSEGESGNVGSSLGSELNVLSDGIVTVAEPFWDADGSIIGVNPDGTPNGEVYFMGIIDILTEYGARKKVEHFGKSLRFDPATISAVNPHDYAERFKQYMGVSFR